MSEPLDLDAIRARAEAARQAAASGTTGTPPNVDGLSIGDAADIFAESAADIPALLAEVDRLAATAERVRELADAWEAGQAVNRRALDAREFLPYKPPTPDDLRAVLLGDENHE